MACSHRWESVCLTQCSFPKDALCAGKDLNGDAIYAGRVHHEGDILPAKVIPAKNACYVSHGGKEHKKTQCEVLVPTPCAKFTWQAACGGSVPPCAFDAGLMANGCEKLYFGRVTHDCCITPGKIHPSQGVCYYPFNHEERKSVQYECLVLL